MRGKKPRPSVRQFIDRDFIEDMTGLDKFQNQLYDKINCHIPNCRQGYANDNKLAGLTASKVAISVFFLLNAKEAREDADGHLPGRQVFFIVGFVVVAHAVVAVVEMRRV